MKITKNKKNRLISSQNNTDAVHNTPETMLCFDNTTGLITN